VALAESEQKDERPWATYARLSKKADGGLEKVEDQVDDSLAYAARTDYIRVDPALVFKDPFLSAWKKRAKRPEWDRMMALAEAGQLAGIVIPAVDRFTRRPKDMEALIELAEEHGLVIEGPRSGRLDLTTATGRQQARWMAMQAAAESDNTSERIKATLRRKMREGKPMGSGRAYGFEKGGLDQRPEEAVVIREVARRMLSGESAASIVRDLGARGIRSSKGQPFTPRELTRMMVRLRNGGHVEHKGRIVGTIPGEPILDPVTYEDLQALVASRRRGRPPTGRFMLTGLAICDRCQRGMNGVTVDGRRRYVCVQAVLQNRHGCGRTIDADGLEEMVERYMIKLLSKPDVVDKISAREQKLTDALSEQLGKVEAVEEQLADLEVKWAAGELVQRAYDRAKPVLDKRLAKEQARLDGLARPTSAMAVDAAADWAEAEPDEKRALITRFGVRITVGAFRSEAPRRFDSKRVRITR
jgi:DNA invertase Pin-like site-specific DNA recombinase